MRELIQKNDNYATISWKLLTGASALTLAAYVFGIGTARADDGSQPAFRLEIGGQFDQLSDKQDLWVPDFVSSAHGGPLAGQYPAFQRTPRIGFDANASVAYRPDGSDWELSISAELGKARQPGSVIKQADILPLFGNGNGNGGFFDFGYYHSFYTGTSHHTESHAVIDFQAGKDVGIGSAETIVRAGVRIAQVKSRSDVKIQTGFPYTFYGSAFNHVTDSLSHKFHGVGPSISWEGSVPVAGTQQDGQLAIDWKADAALLFGRQTTAEKADGLYTQRFYDWAHHRYVVNKQDVQNVHMRRKNVTVPDIGASIGVSYRMNDAKLTLGYRAEWFFNVLDGGVAAAQNENRAFYGPYASISIGLGD